MTLFKLVIMMYTVLLMSAIVTHERNNYLHDGAAVELLFIEPTNNLPFRHRHKRSLQQQKLHLCDKNDDFLPHTPVAV
jgi:hypothetical protein